MHKSERTYRRRKRGLYPESSPMIAIRDDMFRVEDERSCSNLTFQVQNMLFIICVLGLRFMLLGLNQFA